METNGNQPNGSNGIAAVRPSSEVFVAMPVLPQAGEVSCNVCFLYSSKILLYFADVALFEIEYRFDSVPFLKRAQISLIFRLCYFIFQVFVGPGSKKEAEMLGLGLAKLSSRQKEDLAAAKRYAMDVSIKQIMIKQQKAQQENVGLYQIKILNYIFSNRSKLCMHKHCR